MGDAYRASSSVRVKQMEAELSQQLAALRAEIEENGLGGGKGGGGGATGPHNSYSSVVSPKDISFFRTERVHALRRGLQVAAAVPVVSPADVTRRELRSCLSAEHRPDSLPALLHQFHAERAFQLAQSRQQLMLRWRRFGRHSRVLEQLYPHYKAQVSHLSREYEDAVHRARRLSQSREAILSGRDPPAGLLTGGDAAIYLRWLICHLQSVRTVHSFLTVLHYIPARARREKEPEIKVEDTTSPKDADGFPGPASDVPLHTAHLDAFRAELQSLMSHFHLPHSATDLSSSADEMELFSAVWREFRATFRLQEQMKTFPQYDATMEVGESQWGRKSASMAVRKEATWIPFIQVKPRRDPWQQKLLTQLKEEDRVDELLKMHSGFLQVPHFLHVAAALKRHTAHVCDSQSSSVSRDDKTRRQKISEIWSSVYNSSALTQTSRYRSAGSSEKETVKRELSTSASESLQVLGLDDGLDSADPVVSRGAHLSLVFLRHLKLRELQRVALGLLNYLRSVERTLTFDLAGLQLDDRKLCSSAEETRWMNAARGGDGEAAGLGSHQHVHNTPVDYKVRCAEFMQFPEVENLHDFYSSDERFLHVQDHRGVHIVYDAALRDLQELEEELLLIGSRFIQRNRIRQAKTASRQTAEEVDHVAVLLHLWSCEAEFLESKVQLLNCYFEAYQHSTGTEERLALARVIADITHRRPLVELDQDYFVGAYRAEISCLQSHTALIRDVLNKQIERQRRFLHRIWTGDRQASDHDFGLPLNYVPKHPVSLGGSSPALASTFLLELHPSLCMAAAVYQALDQAHAELCQLHRATGAARRVALQQKLLQQAVQSWKHLAPPGASYSPETQRELFSDGVLDNPVLVQSIASCLVASEEEREGKYGREESQPHAVQTLCRLLELVTLRHRLLEAAAETEHLAELYRSVAAELGFDEAHLYLRPLQFDEKSERVQPRPVFITGQLQDDDSVDRFTPSHLPLSVQELDENQIRRFSFSSVEAVTRLVNEASLQNLQVALACQVVQKSALTSAVKLPCLCHWASTRSGVQSERPQGEAAPSRPPRGAPASSEKRLTEAFVSIQLEKVRLRDDMLDSFLKKKQAAGGFIKSAEEAAKIKRELIIDFLFKFSTQMSRHCVRAQIVAYYYSLTSLLDDVPSVRHSHFTVGRADEPERASNQGGDPGDDPRSFRHRPLQLLDADGEAVVNLWYIPHFTRTLHMFETLDVTRRAAALHHTLLIASALHDIFYYLLSFSKLGSREDGGGRERDDAAGSHLAADWGGPEGIGMELQELQRQVERLSDGAKPQTVARLLQLRRQVVLLQFDTAVRNLIREAFLSCGDTVSYHSVTDNMASALPLLSDGLRTEVFSATLPVPPPLRSRSRQARRTFPWRSFLACHGRLALRVWDVPPIEHCVQLCLSGLSSRSRLQANAAILGVSLLMEDVLNSGREARPVRLHDDDSHDVLALQDKRDHSCTGAEEEEGLQEEEEEEARSSSSAPPQDPIRVQSLLKGFLLLTKQLEVFKENWARGRFGAQTFRTAALYQQFLKLYRAEIFLPSMRALAQQMGSTRDYDVLISGSQVLLPPAGAPDVDVKTWQLHLLMESAECDMIKAVQTRVNDELALAAAERTRQETHLPTDLWKKAPLKHSLSLERPQMVETFEQQLMERAEQAEGEVRVSQDHLLRCLSGLASSAMARERRGFLFYSQFYEQILDQQTQLLYHREQDLKSLKETQTRTPHHQAADSCREMMLQIAELQARVAHLEEEKRTSEERLSLRLRERYDPVVRHLLATCIRLKAGLDEYRQQMERDVSVMVNSVRAEGVEHIIKLKKKYGCTKGDDGLIVTHSQKEEVHELKLEVGRLSALLCKLRAASRWRNVVERQKLHRQLLQSQQLELSGRSEALRVKMVSEEKLLVLQEELHVVRRLLTQTQAECSSSRKLLSRKTEELQVARHQSAQEARSRLELDALRAQSLERMRADVEDRDRRLRTLGEQLDRDGRMSRLQRQRSAKEIRQVRGKLQHECSLKQEAFQQVDKLQTQLSHMEATLCGGSSAAGPSRAYYTLSLSRLSTRSPSAVPQRSARQRQLAAGDAPQDVPAEPRPRRPETARSRSHTADLSRLRLRTADVLLPDL